ASRPRSSGTSSGNASWWKINPDRAASRRRAVLSQAPDGYTIGLVTNGTSISAAIYKALPFDPDKEFATISTIGAFDLVFATNVESELKTLDDFIKRARAQPGTLNVGTINVGGTQNLAAEFLKASPRPNFPLLP